MKNNAQFIRKHQKQRILKSLLQFTEIKIYRAVKKISILLMTCVIIAAGYLGFVASLYAADDLADQTKGNLDVVNAVITDYGIVKDGKKQRQALSVRPFLDEWTTFIVVKNTGKTFINHFRISFNCPFDESDAITIDLISPNIPSWLWKPFTGDLLSLGFRDMDFTIKNSSMEMRDDGSGAPIFISKLYPAKSLKPEGLAPGESILVEYTEPYINCIKEFVLSIATRNNIKIETEISDRENNIMIMIIKDYKLAFLNFDQLTSAITFKGVSEYGNCSLKLTIDNKLYDTVPWLKYEWR